MNYIYGSETLPDEKVVRLSDVDNVFAALRAELADRKEAYDTLVGLLQARFPKRKDGSLPDWKIEDVLKENERLRKLIEDFCFDAQSIWYRASTALRSPASPAASEPVPQDENKEKKV